MEAILLSAIQGQGVFAMIAIVLLLYVLKTNDSREKRYQDLIEKLSCKFDDITTELKIIKQKLMG